MKAVPKGVRMDEPDPRDRADSAASTAPGARRLHVLDRSIGDFLRERCGLDERQIAKILAYQQTHRLRFGEAAVALRLVTHEDVLWALSRQFHYPYAAQVVALSIDPEVIVARDPFSDAAEVFRDVRSQLVMGFLGMEEPPQPLAILSPDVGDGKTFFAANFAASLAQLGNRTLVIDANLRTPRLHQLFGTEGSSGLASILAARTDSQVIQRVSALPALFVMPAGTPPPNPLELVQRPALGVLLRELVGKFDYIVVDTPASSHGADARVIAAICGSALVIGRRDVTRMRSLQTLVAQIGRVQVRSAGVLLNDR
jgi:protein-tyrosine kinase